MRSIWIAQDRDDSSLELDRYIFPSSTLIISNSILILGPRLAFILKCDANSGIICTTSSSFAQKFSISIIYEKIEISRRRPYKIVIQKVSWRAATRRTMR